MTSRDEAPASQIDQPLVTAEVLVELDTSQGMVRVASGRTRITLSDGTKFEPAGGLFSIEQLDESAGIEAQGFSIVVSNATSSLMAETMTARLADNDIRLSFAIKTTDDDGNSEWHKYVIKAGKVGNVRVSGQSIAIDAYTPMDVAINPRGFATEWTDDQQRHYVDSTDYIFRFLAQSSEKEIDLTP